MTPPPRKFYLAGPFFNPAQLDLQKSIEVAFCDAGVPFFSPRLQDENKRTTLDGEAAGKIFNRNFEEIWNCSDLLAVIDWTMPEFHFLAPVEITSPEEQVPGLKIGTKINIPDTGTVWELGAAFAMQRHADQMQYQLVNGWRGRSNRRIWMFTQRGPDEKLNLMLTKSADGVIFGLRQLARFLDRGQIDEAVAEKWSGGHV